MQHLAISGLIIFFSSLFSAGLVLSRKPRRATNVTWGLTSISAAAWGFGLFQAFSANFASIALFWGRFLNLSALFIPLFFFHFVISYLSKNKARKKEIIFYYFVVSIYFVAALIVPNIFIKGVFSVFSFKYYPLGGSAYFLFPIIYSYLMMYGISLLIIEWSHASVFKRNQIKYLIAGVVVGIFGGATTFFPIFGIKIYPFGTYLVPFYVLTVAYAIITYRLMDIEVVIARSSILFCVYSAVLLVVAWLWYPMRPYLQALLGARWNFVPMGAFAALSMIAPFIYLYYQQKYDQRRLKSQRVQLAHLKQITATSVDVDYEQLLKNIPPFLVQMYRDDFSIDIDYAAVYFYEKHHDSYKLVSFKSKKSDRALSVETNILKTDSIPNWFIEKAPYFDSQGILDPVYRDAIKYEDLDYYQSRQTDKDFIQAIENLKNNMKQFKADVCVSCFYKNRLLAFLLMGKKQKGSYAQEELDTFSLLAHDIATAVRSGELRDELEQSYIDAIHSIITALEERDIYTKGHSERVVKYSVQIAVELKDAFPFTRIVNFIDKVRRAALLHDVGKIGVPDAILLKPGKLTGEEYEKLKKHPATSLHIVQSIKNLSEDILDGIESHHKRYDGKGYGKGAEGHRVPPLARIIAVADTFDAMTSDRPYRKALSEKAAIDEINRVSGAQFDPKVVEAFNQSRAKNRLKSEQDA